MRASTAEFIEAKGLKLDVSVLRSHILHSAEERKWSEELLMPPGTKVEPERAAEAREQAAHQALVLAKEAIETAGVRTGALRAGGVFA